jgi:DNA-binding NtrC family response regulator
MNILVVDDDKLLLNSLAKNLTHIGYMVTPCETGAGALEILESFTPDIMLLDVKLTDMNGIDVLKKIRKNTPDLPIIMITAFTDVQTVVNAMKSGATDYIGKPIDLDQLELLIEKVGNAVKKDRKIELLQYGLEEERDSLLMTFKSPAMQKALDFIDKVSKSRDTSVLIEGESGTGKEVLARMIHEKSEREKEPYIQINCGALPKDLIENELFGSEKGAFTGALNKTKKGKFELADGGSILLDEIGELPPEAQVKLLRVLQELRYFRIGGNHEIKVDIRVIATTNKNLEEHTAKGMFREDLYYRLNVARIIVPPLRERKEDILPLANLFISEFCKKFNKEPMKLSGEAEQLLKDYRWKGNVRELKNALERVVLFEAEDSIEAENFTFLTPASAMKQEGALSDNFSIRVPSSGVTMAEATSDLIRKTLQMTKGNKVLAAKYLGITRGKLIYRMKQLNITL